MVWNSGALCRRLDGLLSLVRGESTDSDPGDPQDGRDQFARLLKLAGLGFTRRQLALATGKTKPVLQAGATAFPASFQVRDHRFFAKKFDSFFCLSSIQTNFVRLFFAENS
jgi:hypothetical protein